MTSTIEQPDQDRITERDNTDDRAQLKRWKLIAAFLAIVVLGLSAVLAVIVLTGDDDGGASSAPDEVLQVLDDYERAYEEQDVDLMRSIIDEDLFGSFDMYLPETTDPNFTWGLTDSGLLLAVRDNTFSLERSGDLLVAGDGPWVIASRETWTDPFNREEAARIYVVVDDNGTPKLASTYYVNVQYPEIPDFGD